MATASAHDIYNVDPFAMPYGQTGQSEYNLPFTSKPFSIVWGDPRYDNGHVYDIRDRSTWTAPDAYLGLRPKVASDIEMKAFTDSNWYFNVMPIQRVDSDTVSWDSTIYKAHLARPTPVLAPMRLVTSETFTNEATLIRLGVAYKIEHGFLNTEKGYRHHLNTIAQIANSVVEAVKMDILTTLLQAQNLKRNWAVKWGVQNEENAKRVIKDQLDFWAVLQRDKRAINIIDSTINNRLQQVGGQADTYIIPQKMIDYISIVPDEYLEQRKIGPTGPATVLDGPRPYGVWNKDKVYVARAYNISDDNRDLLSSEEEIGEFYRMVPRHINNTRGYTSRSRNIVIYDEDTDSNYEVSLTEALDNSYLFDENGNPSFPDGPHHFTGPNANSDIFKTTEPDGSVQDAYFFGEMDLKYFNAADKLQWAARAFDALSSEAAIRTEDISKAFADGYALLRRLEEIEPIKADFANFSTEESRTEGTGVANVFRSRDVVHDPETDFLVEKNPALPLTKLIGGLQSLAGLRYIVKKNSQNPENLAREADIARRFIDAIDTMTMVLEKYAPGSAFLDPKNASSIWHYPTSATVFFENLVMPHRPPSFLVTGEGVFGGARFQAYFQQPIFDLLQPAPTNVIDPFPERDNPDLMALLRYTMTLVAAQQLEADGLGPVEQVFGTTMNSNYNVAISRSNTAESEIRFAAQQLAKSDAFKISTEAEWKVLFQSMYETLQEAYTRFQDAPAGVEGDTINALGLRYPVLISPAVAAKIQNKYAEDNTSRATIAFWPANPNFPELPMAAAQLDASTLHLATRIADAADKRRALENPDPSVSPAFFSRVGHPHPMTATTFQAAATATAVGHTLEASHFAGNISLGQPETDNIHGGFHAQHYDRIRAEQIGLHESLHLLDPATRHPFTGDVKRVQVTAGRMLSHTYQKSWEAINAAASSPLERILAHVYDSIPITRKAFDSFIQNNLIVPISFLLARPHMRYVMLKLIKCKSGIEMGATFVKPGQFELADDAQIQLHMGTYTADAKAAVIHEQHVFVWHNAFSDGYLGGNGTAWIHPVDYKARNWQGQSLIAIPIGYRENVTDPLSLTGELAFGTSNFPITADGSLQYSTAPRVNALYGFRHAQNYDEYALAPHGSSDSQRSLNVLCHPGHYMMYNEKEREFNIWHRGRGHWGEHTYVGCAKVRDGHMRRFKLPDYTNRIEV